MSDTPVEGWWRAKDGRWYPPETHPDVASGPIVAPPGWVRRADGSWAAPTADAGVEGGIEGGTDPGMDPTTTIAGAEAATYGATARGDKPPVQVVKVGNARRRPRLAAVSVVALLALLGGVYAASKATKGDPTVKVRDETTIRHVTTTSSWDTTTTETTLETTTTVPAPPPPPPPTTTTTTVAPAVRHKAATTTTGPIMFPPYWPPTTAAPPITAAPTTAPPSTDPPTTLGVPPT